MTAARGTSRSRPYRRRTPPGIAAFRSGIRCIRDTCRIAFARPSASLRTPHGHIANLRASRPSRVRPPARSASRAADRWSSTPSRHALLSTPARAGWADRNDPYARAKAARYPDAAFPSSASAGSTRRFMPMVSGPRFRPIRSTENGIRQNRDAVHFQQHRAVPEPCRIKPVIGPAPGIRRKGRGAASGRFRSLAYCSHSIGTPRRQSSNHVLSDAF